MSEALKNMEKDVITAMKAGDRTRVDILRQFVNRVKMTAKNDKNRAVVDADVITAGLKIVKEANETRDIFVEKNVPTDAQDAEISVVSEYLPKRMSVQELRDLIETLRVDAPEGKSARGFFMKTLNGQYKGQFDPQDANKILVDLGY